MRVALQRVTKCWEYTIPGSFPSRMARDNDDFDYSHILPMAVSLWFAASDYRDVDVADVDRRAQQSALEGSCQLHS